MRSGAIIWSNQNTYSDEYTNSDEYPNPNEYTYSDEYTNSDKYTHCQHYSNPDATRMPGFHFIRNIGNNCESFGRCC